MKYIYELIGTFFLVLTVGLTALNPGSALIAPWAIAAVLAAMIYAGGHISGGHYNPAVSLSVYLRGKLSLKEFFFYALVQFLGALLAAFLTLSLRGISSVAVFEIDPTAAFAVEFLFTFALCFVVLNVATVKETKGNSFFGLAIGLIVLVGAYAVGPLSGAVFNPAVALGLSALGTVTFSSLGLYFVANFLGGLVAALLFNKAHKTPEKN